MQTYYTRSHYFCQRFHMLSYIIFLSISSRPKSHTLSPNISTKKQFQRNSCMIAVQHGTCVPVIFVLGARALVKFSLLKASVRHRFVNHQCWQAVSAVSRRSDDVEVDDNSEGPLPAVTRHGPT